MKIRIEPDGTTIVELTPADVAEAITDVLRKHGVDRVGRWRIEVDPQWLEGVGLRVLVPPDATLVVLPPGMKMEHKP